MTSPIKNLSLPLRAEDAKALRLGDIVTVSGLLFTGRSRFHIRAIENNVLPPIDFARANCFFHVGPVTRKDGDAWKIVSAEPTSSIRFDRYGGEVIRRLGLRTIIGKTTMGPGAVAALKEVGGVFLSKIGLCGNELASRVTRVLDVYFLDELGKTEATWLWEVREFGPFFVAIDAWGHSYFEDLDRETAVNMKAVYRDLGVPEDYDYTDVNPSGSATT